MQKNVDMIHATYFSVFPKHSFHTVTVEMLIWVSTNHAAVRSTDAGVRPSL